MEGGVALAHSILQLTTISNDLPGVDFTTVRAAQRLSDDRVLPTTTLLNRWAGEILVLWRHKSLYTNRMETFC